MYTDAFHSMFREYDIRGRISDQELNRDSVSLISKGFASLLAKRNIKSIIIGYDNRKFSEEFANAAIESCISSGFKVYDIGLTISPALYFAQYHLKSLGAIMVTASHNPNGWSGLKLAHGYSMTLGQEEIKELYDIIEKQDFVINAGGGIEKVNIREVYIDYVVSKLNLNKGNAPRVVVDAGNGGAGLFAYEIFQKIGCTVFQLNCDPDMNYPHYFPNPSDITARNRLAEMVLHSYIHADVGISFDGDGDRIGIVDQYGENVWSDRLLMILSRQLLERKKGAKIVFDVKCTQALKEDIDEHGGTPIMWKTGHSHIKAKMKEENADLAGERSGHIFIGGDEYLGFDDAIFAGAKLVEYMSNTNKSLKEILDDFPKYITSPEIKIYCPDNLKYEVVECLVKEFKAEYGDKVIDINGARVLIDGGWGLVRASSNLPELVLVFEAKTEEKLNDIKRIFKNKLLHRTEISVDWENDII